MKKLHKDNKNSTPSSKPEGGLQASLCSNNVPTCSTPSGFIIKSKTNPDNALNRLADILVEAFLEKKKYENSKKTTTKQESGYILPSINKRTS
jgi:hypothetical protein